MIITFYIFCPLSIFLEKDSIRMQVEISSCGAFHLSVVSICCCCCFVVVVRMSVEARLWGSRF